MIIDWHLLQPAHLIIFGGSFVGLFTLIGLGLHYGWLVRAHHQRRGVYFAGFLLLLVIIAAIYLIVSPASLRLSLIVAGALILLVGTLDEYQALPARPQLVWQIIIAAVVVGGGWTIPYVSHPLHEGVLSLGWWQWQTLLFPGSLLALLWYVFLMNAINWLDGVDGLASGVGLVACCMLAAVSLLPSIQDGRTLSLSLVGAGSLLAFWLWNWPPARIFLGTTGSWFLGLYLGLTATLGGGKVVTTLLILALPVLDVGLVLWQRWRAGQSLWEGDQVRHLHHRLLAAGYSSRTITIMAMSVTALLGMCALLLQTQQKIIALGLVALILISVGSVILGKSSRSAV